MTNEERDAIIRWHVVHEQASVIEAAREMIPDLGHELMEAMLEQGMVFAITHPWEAKQMLEVWDKAQDPDVLEARGRVIHDMFDIEDFRNQPIPGLIHRDGLN